MRNLTATICLTLAMFLGSAGVSWSADFQKGVTAYQSGDYATALREWKPERWFAIIFLVRLRIVERSEALVEALQ